MKNLKVSIWTTVIAFCLIAFFIMIPYYSTFGNNLSHNHDDWGTFGSYFSGLFMPFVTLMNIIVLIILSRSINSIVSEIRSNHNDKITEQNKDVNNEYKIKIDPNVNIEELYELLLQNNKRANEVMDHLDKSLGSCEVDLKKLFNLVKVDVTLLDTIPYYRNPFVNRGWEMRAIGIINWRTANHLYMLQLKVKMYELLSANDSSYIKQYKNALKEFEAEHKNASYVD